MKLIEDYSLTQIANIESKVNQYFSIDTYLTKNSKNFASIATGLNDENFSLENEFYGEITFSIFRMDKYIESTAVFLEDAKKEKYLLTGVKGIATILLFPEKLSSINSWILSPHKILQPSELWSNGVPYLGRSTKNDDFLLHYSNYSVSDLESGMYILLGRKH